MRWIIVDVVLALLALALLAVVALGLWRRVKALGRTVGAATAQLEAATAVLDGSRSAEPAFAAATRAGHLERGRQQPSGVGSSRSS